LLPYEISPDELAESPKIGRFVRISHKRYGNDASLVAKVGRMTGLQRRHRHHPASGSAVRGGVRTAFERCSSHLPAVAKHSIWFLGVTISAGEIHRRAPGALTPTTIREFAP
jgi:hypothetical protein